MILLALVTAAGVATPDGGLAMADGGPVTLDGSVAVLDGGGAAKDAGAATKLDPANPATWRLSEKLPKGSTARDALVREWTHLPATAGEAALTVKEADTILDDPRAERIYGDRTVSIVAPSMLSRQRQQHLDLLALFMRPERLAAGAEFFRAHRAVLERSRERHHVDPAVVVSILMWESKLGTMVGDYFAFNSFASQAFFIDEANAVALKKKSERASLSPEKQAERVESIRRRARLNLDALVRACKAKGIDPLSVKGSWAGALGYPQFMPASLRWAEDGNGDGKIDLYTFDDSIASIARYLGDHGFEKDRSKAVWEYNHEGAYVKGVLAYADALTALLSAPPDGGVGDAGPHGQ
jgi:membrane-bound lytic murein transglycosylase B